MPFDRKVNPEVDAIGSRLVQYLGDHPEEFREWMNHLGNPEVWKDSEQTESTMQEEFDKQQERKRKMYLAGQTALEELKYKENGPYFSDILKEMQELYEKKNHDYGNSFSETIREFGFTPAIARINDKLKRVKQMVKGEQMRVNESMRNNLIDIANYCILTIIEIDKSS